MRAWRIAYLVLCTIGICLSADLQRLHVKVHTDPDYHSYCAMSERVNCETVAASQVSVFLGMPLAAWGLFGYTLLAALCIWGLRRQLRSSSWPFGAIFGLSAFTAVSGLVLFAVSHFVIKSVCIVCGGTYLVNLGLLAIAFMDLRRHGHSPSSAVREEIRAARQSPRAVVVFGAVFAALLAGAWLGIPAYWTIKATTGPEGLNVGYTQEGHPWIGAPEPVLDIIEYSDYQCPHCSRGHDEIRRLIREHPKKIRLVHRHYPLDHNCNPIVSRPFHPKACDYARLAFCADKQEKFWEANDYIFVNGRRRDAITPTELAQAVGLDDAALSSCADSDEAKQAVDLDLSAGRALKIRGTPTFVIGERTYPGRIPKEVFDKALGLATKPGDATAAPE